MKRIKDPFAKTYTDSRYRSLLHLLFWTFFFGSHFYFSTISFNPIRETPATYLLAIKNTVVLAIAFYTLMYFVWPQTFARGKWVPGLFALLIWLITIGALDTWGDRLVFNSCQSCLQGLAQYSPEYHAFLQKQFFTIVLARVLSGGLLFQLIIQLSFPVALKLGRSYFRQTVQQLQLAKDNLQLEFNFLKSQVNPHFLFNTLNNIYALVKAERNSQAAATLSRLSGFMRYALYETSDEKILLEKEVQLLKDYVELEKLRLNETTVDFHFEADRDDYLLPPLLFLPALENAFKYTSDEKESRISVNIAARDGRLQVTIENSHTPWEGSKSGGIGYKNLQKRLQHYYGNKGLYTASTTNSVYLFGLSCPL